METNEKTKLEEAGAFWIKTSKAGTQFLTGKIKSKSGEEISVMVFKNKYKEEGSNQPDYRIYHDNKSTVKSSIPETPETSKPVNKTVKKSESKSEIKTEEIPF
jgi:uncharacterized protein (DUF736 family)